MGPKTGSRSSGHHAVPQHLLRRFADSSERLTVVRSVPEPMVLRRQKVKEVGTHRDLNSWRRPDGSWDDGLETGPVANLDAAGAGALRVVDEFVTEARADEHPRLLDRPAIEHAALYAAVAGFMVRSPEMRERLESQALPTLKREMLANLDRATTDGIASADIEQVVREAIELPGAVTLDPGDNHHQALLLPLLRTVTASLGTRFLVSVRRLSRDLLVTGSEPVVVLEEGTLRAGGSFARLLAVREDPVRLWDEQPAVLAHVERLLDGVRGALVAIDPRTLLVLCDPLADDGAELLFMVSELSEETLAGLTNVFVTGASRWIAGRDGTDWLDLSTRAMRSELRAHQT